MPLDQIPTIDYRRLRKATRQLDHIPGENGWPIIGQTLQLLADPPGLTARLHKKYGPIHRVNWMFERAAVFLGADAVQAVLKDPEQNFSSRLGWQSFFGEMFPGAVLLRDFEDHRYHRRIMQPAFSPSAMRGYMTRLNDVIQTGIIDWPQRHNFRAYTALKSLILDTAANVFLGLPLGPNAARVNQAVIDVVNALIAVVRYPVPGLAMWRGMRSRRYLQEYFRGLIAERRTGEGTDMLSQLCHARSEEGEVFSDQEIVDHMIFMIIAAHDTTTATLTNMLYELSLHPEWQDRLRAEYEAPDKDEPEHEDLEGLKLTEWVFKEVLRLYPPVRMIARRTVRACELQGVKLPANTTVWVSPEFTHLMPELWSEPTRFDPERFSDERAEHKRHSYAWFPFGGGAHTCIGMRFSEVQVKLTMFHLLRAYRFKLPPGYKADYQILPIRKPKDDLPLIIESA